MADSIKKGRRIKNDHSLRTSEYSLGVPGKNADTPSRNRIVFLPSCNTANLFSRLSCGGDFAAGAGAEINSENLLSLRNPTVSIIYPARSGEPPLSHYPSLSIVCDIENYGIRVGITLPATFPDHVGPMDTDTERDRRRVI